MWILFIIPLAIVTGSEILNEDCSLPVHAVCRSADIPEKFPTTEGELDDFCDSMTKFLECGISVEERCQFEPEIIEPATVVLSTLNEVCDKDNSLHTALVNNLQCMDEFIESRTARQCHFHELDEELFKERVEDLVDQGLVSSENEHNMRECLKGLYVVACAAVKLEESCGEDAMELFVEVLRKVSVALMDECSEELEAVLPTIVAMYKLDMEKVNVPDFELFEE